MKSEIRDKGRAGYYMLVDEKGNVLKDFGDNKDQMNAFKIQLVTLANN